MSQALDAGGHRCTHPQTPLSGQDVAAGIATELADNLLALDRRLGDLEEPIADTFDHPQAPTNPVDARFRPVLDATLLVAACDTITKQQARRTEPLERTTTLIAPARSGSVTPTVCLTNHFP